MLLHSAYFHLPSLSVLNVKRQKINPNKETKKLDTTHAAYFKLTEAESTLMRPFWNAKIVLNHKSLKNRLFISTKSTSPQLFSTCYPYKHSKRNTEFVHYSTTSHSSSILRLPGDCCWFSSDITGTCAADSDRHLARRLDVPLSRFQLSLWWRPPLCLCRRGSFSALAPSISRSLAACSFSCSPFPRSYSSCRFRSPTRCNWPNTAKRTFDCCFTQLQIDSKRKAAEKEARVSNEISYK